MELGIAGAFAECNITYLMGRYGGAAEGENSLRFVLGKSLFGIVAVLFLLNKFDIGIACGDDFV